MNALRTYYFLILLGIVASLNAQNITVYGKVTDNATSKSLPFVSVQIQNSNYGANTNKNGSFSISVPTKKHLSVLFKLLGYTNRVKELDIEEGQDSILINVSLSQSYLSLDTFTVYGKVKPDTLVGAPDYSIFDFDFMKINTFYSQPKNFRKSATQISRCQW
ncbi:MAG: carboxypeptidase-like regulatory domain-containing protein [Bacteroidetes bacterium]|nr:carboxypeptidase-like regulatory domain-containing protein [Bacteroidota bacterium]